MPPSAPSASGPRLFGQLIRPRALFGESSMFWPSPLRRAASSLGTMREKSPDALSQSRGGRVRTWLTQARTFLFFERS